VRKHFSTATNCEAEFRVLFSIPFDIAKSCKVPHYKKTLIKVGVLRPIENALILRLQTLFPLGLSATANIEGLPMDWRSYYPVLSLVRCVFCPIDAKRKRDTGREVRLFSDPRRGGMRGGRRRLRCGQATSRGGFSRRILTADSHGGFSRRILTAAVCARDYVLRGERIPADAALLYRRRAREERKSSRLGAPGGDVGYVAGVAGEEIWHPKWHQADSAPVFVGFWGVGHSKGGTLIIQKIKAGR